VRLVAPAIAAEDVVTNGCDQKEVEVIRKTTKKEDLRTVQLLGWMGWNSSELVDERMGAARYVQCSIFVDGFFPRSDRPATRKFVDQFQANYQRQPLLLEAHAHDAAGILKSVIQSTSPQTRDDLRNALASMPKPFPGAAGDTVFGKDRESQKPLFWLWINRGQILEFDPNGQPPVPPVATAEAPVRQ
jgi:ABC-type branched-subunit amino acid transport system substrate-binding protein